MTEPMSDDRLEEIRNLDTSLTGPDAPYDPTALALDEARRDLLAEVDRLRALTAECTCGTPGMDYDGPRPDCAVHGAVRAYHEARAEVDWLRDAVEHLTGVIADKNKEIQRLYAEFEQSTLGDRIGALEADLISIVRSLEHGADEDALRTAKSALYGDTVTEGDA